MFQGEGWKQLLEQEEMTFPNTVHQNQNHFFFFFHPFGFVHIQWSWRDSILIQWWRQLWCCIKFVAQVVMWCALVCRCTDHTSDVLQSIEWLLQSVPTAVSTSSGMHTSWIISFNMLCTLHTCAVRMQKWTPQHMPYAQSSSRRKRLLEKDNQIMRKIINFYHMITSLFVYICPVL